MRGIKLDAQPPAQRDSLLQIDDLIQRQKLPEEFFKRYTGILDAAPDKRACRVMFETLPKDVIKKICTVAGFRFTGDKDRAALSQKLLPLRQALFVVRHLADKHNFLSEQGDVLETGSVVEIKRGVLRLLRVVKYPTVFYDFPDGATDYTRSLAYCLDDGKYATTPEILEVLYKAPAKVRGQVADLVAVIYKPIAFDEEGKILDDDLTLLDIMREHLPDGQIDSRKLVAASQELLANGFIVKAMEYLSSA